MVDGCRKTLHKEVGNYLSGLVCVRKIDKKLFLSYVLILSEAF